MKFSCSSSASLVGARQRVTGRHDQRELVAEEGKVGEALRGRDDVDHPDVGPAFQQRAGNLRAHALLDVDADARVAARELLHPLGQHLQQGRGVREHADVAGQAQAPVAQVGGEQVGVGQQLAPALHQHAAGGGQLDAARGTFEDPNAQRRLHGGDPGAGRGHGQPQAVAAGADGAGLGDSDHDA
jgi:hypothetical protein